MMNNTDSFYTTVEPYLQQSDIFRLDIIAPVADTEKRIFRTHDCQHGSVYFEGKTQAKIFSEEELSESLSLITPKTEWHISPFTKTKDGQEEMVVAAARRFRYFILASQSCDISGKDKPPLSWGTILPIVTVECMCKEEKLPFKGTSESCSIHDYIVESCDDGTVLQNTNEFNYGSVIRSKLPDWIKESTGKKKERLQQIKNFINNFSKKNFVHSVPENSHIKLPESYIDFTMICIVPTSKLEGIKEHRIARLSVLYDVQFGQNFGSFFSRVATRRPMVPPDIKG